jgi:hypothetical protein
MARLVGRVKDAKQATKLNKAIGDDIFKNKWGEDKLQLNGAGLHTHMDEFFSGAKYNVAGGFMPHLERRIMQHHSVSQLQDDAADQFVISLDWGSRAAIEGNKPVLSTTVSPEQISNCNVIVDRPWCRTFDGGNGRGPGPWSGRFGVDRPPDGKMHDQHVGLGDYVQGTDSQDATAVECIVQVCASQPNF